LLFIGSDHEYYRICTEAEYYQLQGLLDTLSQIAPKVEKKEGKKQK
jgi:hypothetical protein